MKIPDSLKRFVGEAQWKKLCMDELDDEDRKMLVGLLEAGFEGIDPDEISPGDVEETLELVQGLSDDLRGAWDDGEMTEEELSAGEQTSDEVIEELKSEVAAKKLTGSQGRSGTRASGSKPGKKRGGKSS